MRAVQAFKRSLKRSTKEKEKKEEGEPGCNKELVVGLSKSPLTCSQAQGPPGYERRDRRTGEDDLEFEDEQRLGVLKRKSPGQDKGSSEEADTDKMLAATSAFRNSVGKIKKNSKTSVSGPPRAGLS